MRKLEITFVAVLTALAFVMAAGAPDVAWAAHEQDASPRTNHDRHAGYYYPLPQTRETYTAQAITLPNSNRARRLGFVTAMTAGMMGNNYAPPFAMFAKGDDAEKLIIVSVREGAYNTLYRGRALLAMLTSITRTTPIFQQFGVEEVFNFFDLAKMLGFQLITISDGDQYAHQIFIE